MKTLILYVALAAAVAAVGEDGRVLEPLKPDSPARLIGFEPFDARTAGIRNK